MGIYFMCTGCLPIWMHIWHSHMKYIAVDDSFSKEETSHQLPDLFLLRAIKRKIRVKLSPWRGNEADASSVSPSSERRSKDRNIDVLPPISSLFPINYFHFLVIFFVGDEISTLLSFVWRKQSWFGGIMCRLGCPVFLKAMFSSEALLSLCWHLPFWRHFLTGKIVVFFLGQR